MMDGYYEIEATVVSGFENIAKDEIESVIVADIIEIKRGRVHFRLETAKLKKVLQLRSVDNLYFMVKLFKEIQFPEEKAEALNYIQSLVKDIDWPLALKIWNIIFDKSVDVPKYRVSCKRSGNHCFESPQVAASFGGTLNDFCGWIVDLNNFDIEVMLIINDNEIRVCIALTNESLHRRNIVNFGNTTLKPTIAYGMLWHCRILPGDIVCDPLCGTGSILIEVLALINSCFIIGGEINSKLVLKTLDNYKSFTENTKNPIKHFACFDIFNWDACRLPLKNNSIDVIVSDLPFGKRVGSRKGNWKLYPGVLNEFARIARISSGRACLLTKDKKCFTKSIDSLKIFWKRGPTININIGGLSAYVYILYRTATNHHLT